MLVTGDRVPGTASSLGYSVFTPGTAAGAGAPRDRGGRVRASPVRASCAWTTGPSAFRAGDALHIPAGVWHAVANTGDEDVVMVFGFPHPDYPPTERA